MSMVIQGPRLQDEIIYCRYIEREIEFPVQTCSLYNHSAVPSIHDMKEDAIYIDVNKKTNKVGFRRWDDLPPEERHRSLE